MQNEKAKRLLLKLVDSFLRGPGVVQNVPRGIIKDFHIMNINELSDSVSSISSAVALSMIYTGSILSY